MMRPLGVVGETGSQTRGVRERERGKQKDRQAEGQAGRGTGRQKDRQAEGQAGRQERGPLTQVYML